MHFVIVKESKTLWFSDRFIFKRQRIYSGWKGRSVLNYNPGSKSWDTLHFWGVFQCTQVQPLPSPHKQCWTRVSRIFSEFQLCVGWGEGELQENSEKGTLFYEETEKWRKNMNIAVLSQGLLSMIVGKWKGRHFSVEGTNIWMRYRLCQKRYVTE